MLAETDLPHRLSGSSDLQQSMKEVLMLLKVASFAFWTLSRVVRMPSFSFSMDCSIESARSLKTCSGSLNLSDNQMNTRISLLFSCALVYKRSGHIRSWELHSEGISEEK
jgi:hypothetical protein